LDVLRYRHEMRHRQHLAVTGALVAAAAALTGCFTSTADFREDAETFIESDERLRAAAFFDTAGSFVEATCDEPASRDEGETFACTATDSNGDLWEFEIVITGTTEYEVVIARRPPDA
jgi:hypothetical protein